MIPKLIQTNLVPQAMSEIRKLKGGGNTSRFYLDDGYSIGTIRFDTSVSSYCTNLQSVKSREKFIATKK